MKMMGSYVGVLLLLILCVWMPWNNIGSFAAERPSVVNVGVLFAFNSTNGRVAKAAMELAVKDVNNNSLLGETKLQLNVVDSHCSAFIGTAAALELLKKDVVAIIGPQSSVLAHIVSHLTKEIQIPVLSFAATDPTLTSSEYPNFIRMAHNDVSQMTAIAAIVDYYGWREVVAVYADDDYGRNGVSALEDALVNVGARITSKAAMLPDISKSEMGNVLAKLTLVEARVIVVHMNSDVGLNLFSKAKEKGMLSNGYVWIVTDWLSSVLDSTGLATDEINLLQGVLGLRRRIPNSEQLKEFTGEWKSLQKANTVDVSLNVFGLYAYDTILMIARSINSFLNQGGNFSFAEQSILSNKSGSNSELAALKVFPGGTKLRKIILKTNFTGVSGPVQLNENRDLMGSAFEIMNIAGTGFRSIGYWSNNTGLSVKPPQYSAITSQNQTHESPELPDVIWPGGSKQVPRGWAFPDNGRELVIGVPRKQGFKEFISIGNDSQIPTGFCIDVFLAAVNLLPYALPHKFAIFGTGNATPSYDDLVKQVFSENYDAVVGDISIVQERTKIVDFTQPYVESGLVVVVPVKMMSSSAWAFLRPFTLQMWCTTGGFFIFIGTVVWILEHRSNPEFRGQPKEQIVNVLWFAFSTMFFAHRENTVSSLGRAVLIIWLFVVLIITSSYTASLTSILTVEKLSTTIQGIDSLAATDYLIGYQAGSFVAEYLSAEFHIDKNRLVPLGDQDSYAKAMSLSPKEGGVAAIVDELPYVESFLATECAFTMVGSEFTRSGWGFVFPKDSELAVDMSTAILTLSENGDLQRIHDEWLTSDKCSKAGAGQADQFGLESFWGIFLFTGLVCFAALFIFFSRMICQFTRRGDKCSGESPGKVIRSFASYVVEREDNERESRVEGKRHVKEKEMDSISELG